jgi:general secretion pathway protein G
MLPGWVEGLVRAMRNGRQRGVRQAGWTILELVVAMAIAGILTAIAVPLYVGYRERAMVQQAIRDMRVIEAGIKVFRDEYGGPPKQLSQAVQDVPLDPWGHPYEYLDLLSGAPGVNGKRRKDKNLVPINTEYDLYSKGADGDSKAPLTAPQSHDDVVRANDGAFMGLASDY